MTRVFRLYRGTGTGGAPESPEKAEAGGRPQPTPTVATQESAVDFAHDVLANSLAIPVLTVKDEYPRELERIVAGARNAGGHPLRQRGGVYVAAYSGVCSGAEDRTGAH